MFSEDDYSNPNLAAFRPDIVYNLSGGGITIDYLDRILGITNTHGKIALIGVGFSSMVKLAVELIDYTNKINKLKDAKPLLDKLRRE